MIILYNFVLLKSFTKNDSLMNFVTYVFLRCRRTYTLNNISEENDGKVGLKTFSVTPFWLKLVCGYRALLLPI